MDVVGRFEIIISGRLDRRVIIYIYTKIFKCQISRTESLISIGSYKIATGGNPINTDSNQITNGRNR